MGLAASQARLLTITARKADCEFQSMSLSHQKLALARDMEKVSNDYQTALNTTKLVYDYYGSGDSDMDLTYDLLMSPSIYNDYYPKLVTDAKNRVILNSAYASAARAAGIPAEGLLGTPSSDVRNKFIEALVGENIITSTQAASIEGVTYGNTLGLGDTVSVTQGTTEITYDELVDMLKASSVDTSTKGITLGSTTDTGGFGDEYFGYSTNGGSWQNDTNLTIEKLLSDDTEYYLSMLSRQGEEIPFVQADMLQQKIVNKILPWIQEAFTSILGGTAASNTALQYAYNAVYDLIVPNNNIQDWIEDNQGKVSEGDKGERQKTFGAEENPTLKGYLDDIGQCEGTKGKRGHDTNQAMKAGDYLGFYYTSDKNQWFMHKDRKDKSQISISLNNVMDVFLTAYVQYMEGIEESEYYWQKGSLSDSNLYDPKDSDFTFTIVADSSTSDEDSLIQANYYDTLFNMICLNGWTENAQIDDSEYLSEMLKSGMAFISSISDDGYYYQGNYSTDKYILEVTDDEAISKAEAKYNTEKTKIENKEDTIDLKMKNLDTEISSLTTEYDTTKSIISKSIEKSFKRYDA